MQQQYATISARNKGPSGCWIVGYAQVTLLLGGKPLGRAATPAHAGRPATYLAGGRTATASLHGPSTCQAGVSDHVRVTAPGQLSATVVELPMRGCALVIEALHAH